jgi:predicted ATP-dependent endonuclease of OLD family
LADDRFYVKTLRLQNFRCFKDTTLGPFDPHFNLLVGENGAGKTTVLSALARLFGTVGAIQQNQNKVSRRSRSDFSYDYRTNPTGVTSLSIAPSFTLQGAANFGAFELEASETLHIEKNDNDSPAAVRDKKTNVVASPGRTLDGQLFEKVCPIVTFYRADRTFRGPGLVDLETAA